MPPNAPPAPSAPYLQPALTDSAYIREHYRKRTARIPMRDGAHLYTVVYTPRDASPAKRYPILLQRTPFAAVPYGDTTYATTLGPDPFMLRDGYIFVSQEVRGRYLSEGTFENVRPLLPESVKRRNAGATDEATDAWDTIAWLVRNLDGNAGRVGLYGASYGGYYAAMASLSRHPAIVASSLQAPVADFYFEDFHHNGALLQGHLSAFPVFGTARATPTASNWWIPSYVRASMPDGANDYDWHLALGPLRAVTQRLLPDDLWWRAVVQHPNYDAFWRARALPPRLTGITHPVLVVGGWYDAENLYGALAVHRALTTQNPKDAVSFVMGPWAHRAWSARGVVHSTHGDLYFGDSLETRFQRDVEAAWYRAHLKGTGRAATAAARMFDTGRNEWISLPSWPARGGAPRVLHLTPTGTLDSRPPAGPRRWVEFTSDPMHPVPARCNGPTIEDGVLDRVMSGNQRCFADRADVATFRSAPLPRDMTVSGETVARLVFSTTGTDADVVVKLIDVYPADTPDHPHRADTTVHLAGYQQLVRGEIMRARFRNSFATPIPMLANEPTAVTVRLPDVLHTFRAGHRIMVQVQGSWFPYFDRNPQRYVPSVYDATPDDFVSARHRVFTGPGASRIELRVMP